MAVTSPEDSQGLPKPLAMDSGARDADEPAGGGSASLNETLTQVVHAWADAWSRQDVDRYLAHYAPDFRPEKGVSRDTWAAQRRVRVARPKSISVTVGPITLDTVDDNRIAVTFEQAYRANHYRDRVMKTLDLRRYGDRWKIVREVSH